LSGPKKQNPIREIIARCGFKCNLCLIYRDNLKRVKDRERFRDGLLKYYGHKLTLEECYCDGCLTDDSENPVLITADCPVRPCVMAKGLENCAYCDKYPCQELERKFIDYQKIRERFGAPIPEEDYRRFIMPYEGRQVLEKIRRKAGLKRNRKTRI
jgi:hypothetical protein